MPLCMSKPQFKPHTESSECRKMSCQLVKHFYKWSWLKALNLISNLCIHFITFVSVLFFVLHERIFSSCYMNQNEFITAALLDGRQGCRHVLNTEFWLPETPWETSVWIGLCSECCVLQLTFVKDVSTSFLLHTCFLREHVGSQHRQLNSFQNIRVQYGSKHNPFYL